MDLAIIRSKIDGIKKKIRDKSSRETRTLGNPHDSNIDRELSNAGKARKAEDIPKQDTVTRRGDLVSGNVQGGFESSTVATRKPYKIGPALRPNITHDKGFSIFPEEEPSLGDYWELLKWTSMLEGAAVLRPDLVDGTAAYAHFLHGEGEPRSFSYDRYVNNDSSGRVTLRNAILEAQHAAIELWGSNGKPETFSFTGPGIPCGLSVGHKSFMYIQQSFPYPSTENWQKAIGAHTIWLSGTVTVKLNAVKPEQTEFDMKMTLHAEDQYNFNPGMTDIATGISDNSNGRFVIVGFAHGYRNSSTLTRRFSWKGSDLGVSSMGLNIQLRQRKPSIQRRS